MNSLTEASALELAQVYRQKTTSPAEVLEATLLRIDEINPVINAYRVVDREGARAAALESAQRLKEGTALSLLDGVPVAVKDLILTKNLSTLRGSLSIDPNQPWDIDAPSVARLREAGAVILGKTTTPEFGCKGVTDSFVTGISRNPYRTLASPGGSSGGSAAAVAGELAPLALGTDGAGSIRIPSAFCGVVGLKASFGRIPAWPASPFGSLAHVGPHARSVADCALALDILSAPDARDWTALPKGKADYALGMKQGVAGLKVAYSPTLGYAQVDEEIAAATAHAASVLSDLGADITHCDPGFDDPLELICALWFAGSATLLDAMPPEKRRGADPMLQWQAREGAKLTAVDLTKLNMRRADLGRRMREFHQRFDILLTPSMPVTAPAAVDTAAALLSAQDMGKLFGWTPFTYPFNLTQQPAITLPSGLARNGLPMGVQLVANMHDDALLLRCAFALEQGLAKMPRATFLA